MENLNIGHISIGDRSRVAGTITAYETLCAFPSADRPGCALIEVRLDLVGTDHPDWLEHCVAIETAGFPVILTIRDSSEGGRWRGDETARRALLERAVASLSTVDIEAGSGICTAMCETAQEAGKPVILSFHDFEKTPPLPELRKRVAEIRQHQNAIPKIATMITDDEALQVLSALLSESSAGPICVIGMGTLGRDTRVSFAYAGSCLTYGYIDESSAPGQWSAAQMVEKLR